MTSLIHRDDDPPHEVEEPCSVCQLDTAECICPRCPTCHTIGDPKCYLPGGHNLLLTRSQAVLRVLARARHLRDQALDEEVYANYLEHHSTNTSDLHLSDYPTE